MPLDPQSRNLRARLGAHASWANTTDPAARTKPARAAFMERFEREVDPDGVLKPEERQRRADHARRAHFLGLAYKSAKARRAKSANRKVAEAAVEMQAIVDEIAGGAA